MEHHVPKITGPLFAKWCVFDKIRQFWELSDDFSDLFAHVNLMLDIVFIFYVQSQVAEMERGVVCLQKYFVPYHDFFCQVFSQYGNILNEWEHSVKLRFDKFGPFYISSHSTWPRRELATLLGSGTPQQIK